MGWGMCHTKLDATLSLSKNLKSQKKTKKILKFQIKVPSYTNIKVAKTIK